MFLRLIASKNVAMLLQQHSHELRAHLRPLFALGHPSVSNAFFNLSTFIDVNPAEFGDKGWWYAPTREGQLVQCTGCRELWHVDQFAEERGRRQARCEQCMQKAVKKRKVEAKKAARKGVVCMTADPRYASREDERSGGDVLLDASRITSDRAGTMTLNFFVPALQTGSSSKRVRKS